VNNQARSERLSAVPRYVFTLQVRPDRLDEYVERHAAVFRRWQAEMASYFVDLEGTTPDRGMQVLREVFNLEAQLARATDSGEA
jgi:L-rhamnose mutarotase